MEIKWGILESSEAVQSTLAEPGPVALQEINT